MKILVTGAKGFIGKNLIAQLKSSNSHIIYEVNTDTPGELLKQYCADCDFVFHLAGVNRPKREEEFMEGNGEFTKKLLCELEQHNNCTPIAVTSSIQAELNNPYGKSKKYSESLLVHYSEKNNVPVFIYRLPNVFGKWCRPEYNSVVATFCSRIANNLPIEIHDAGKELELVYIDDVVDCLLTSMERTQEQQEKYFQVPLTYPVTVGQIAEMLQSFRDSRKKLYIPSSLEDGLIKKMYSTYLSYVPQNDLSYSLKMNRDDRGSFTEVIKTIHQGQVSVNISHPGITRGNHWHHSKYEKFIVISGEGLIKLRQVYSDEIEKYPVSGEHMQVIDIPPGYVHNITNVGVNDLVTLMWCNECFDPKKSDTYFATVDEGEK